MRLSFLAIGVLLASFLLGQTEKRETPLTSLPYSPSLDLTSMDRSVGPCVEFYKYSCGGWIKKNPIPADEARWEVYGKLAQDDRRFLWGILQQAAQNNRSRGKLETQIGDYFAACMDEAGIEKLGAAPIKPGLAEIDGMKSLKEVPALLAR